jgi:putative ABC transport system substrate-binding protein
MLVAAGWAGLAAGLPALAQAQKAARVGVLSPAAQSDPAARAQFAIFTGRLRELGYVEGKSLALDWRFADGQYDRLQMLAGELVKAKADVIVTNGTPATSAARRATATVPIVAMSLADPVGSGFARSLDRPGGNVTGLATMESAVDEKRIELLLEAVPGAKRIGVIVSADNAFYLRELPGLEAAAKKRGCEIVLANVHSVRDLKEGFAMLATRRAEVLLVGDDPFLNSQAGAVAGQALHYKLPSVFAITRGVAEGGLLGYVNDTTQRFRSAADYVDRILKGAKAGELAIEQPMKFDLAVNKKTAAALGIALPDSILKRASKVIE